MLRSTDSCSLLWRSGRGLDIAMDVFLGVPRLSGGCDMPTNRQVPILEGTHV